MKKKIICLLLCLVFVFTLTSCFKDERNYNYKDMTKFVTLVAYKGHVVDVEKDYIQQTIDNHIMNKATNLYKAQAGDDIYVNLKFTQVTFLDSDGTINQKGNEIESLTKKDLFIDNLGEGSYNKKLEELIIQWGIKITKSDEKIVELPNEEMFGEYAGKKVYFSCEFADKACLKGDVVTVDYVGYYLDDKGEIKLNDKGEKDSFDEGKDATFYLGSKLAIEDFEKGIVGMRIGEKYKKMIEATFPSDYGVEDLKGKKVKFEVTLKNIKETPIYNDEFVEKNFEQKTTKEFEDAIIAEYAYSTMSQWILDNSEFIKYPKNEYRQLRKDFESLDSLYLSTYGISFEDYVLAYYGMSKDEYIKASMEPSILYYAISQVENIVPTEAQIASAKETLIKDYTSQYKSQYTGITEAEAREMATDYVEQQLGTAYYYEEALFELIEAHIKGNYTINMKDATYESVTNTKNK